jgi:hypothetical protein
MRPVPWDDRAQRTVPGPGQAFSPPDGAAAEDPLKREGHLLGKPGRPATLGLLGEHPATRNTTTTTATRNTATRQHAPGPGRRHNRPAVAALHLTQPPDQVHAAALGALVEVTCPITGHLTSRADKHLAVVSDSAPPRAVPTDGVGLPRTAAIAGHRAWSSPGNPGEPPPGRHCSLSPGCARILGQCPRPGRRAPSGSRRCHAPGEPGSPHTTGPRRPCR